MNYAKRLTDWTLKHPSRSWSVVPTSKGTLEIVVTGLFDHTGKNETFRCPVRTEKDSDQGVSVLVVFMSHKGEQI